MEGTTLQNQFITEREKAALKAHVFGGVDDWRLLFQMAGGYTESEKSLTVFISRWKNSPKVKTEIEAQRREKFTIEQAQRERWREEEREREERAESESREPKAKRRVDFTSPDEQKRLLNDLINNTNDPDQKLDALKIIIAGQRDDRQAAKEGRQVRAYLPQNCRDCVLYQREKAKQEKKTQ